MAQIGWIEITTEDGATGYLWYLKSEHETRLRFDDYLETAMIEAVPAEQGSGGCSYRTGAGIQELDLMVSSTVCRNKEETFGTVETQLFS